MSRARLSAVDLDAHLVTLDTMSPGELRAAWTRLMKTTPPKASASLLRLALAYELQARVHGGLSKPVERQLREAGIRRAAVPAARPGMRLVRAWQGTAHIVSVADDGVVHWNDRQWRSLSEVARAITGTRWSGPAFFGLKTKSKRAA